ncbi:F-box only protein 40-like [Halichondria panicea]|uniref:F-box only protein 40-like n=1 Tax=Halichondria panicea TaxID=6063 RepID=UPI00312BC648
MTKSTSATPLENHCCLEIFNDMSLLTQDPLQEFSLPSNLKLDESHHVHCQVCISAHCQHPSSASCPFEYCRNGCGFSMHQCKLDEHDQNTCPEALAPCSNAGYGCNEIMKRKKIGNHIQHCPASVLVCKFSHQRIEHSHTSIEIVEPSYVDEQLIDQKFLEGDLEVWKTNKLKVSSSSGKEKLLVPTSMDCDRNDFDLNSDNPDKDTTILPSLSFDNDIGVMTKQYWAAKRGYTPEAASLSRRACISWSIPVDNDPFFTHSAKRAKTHPACTFMCNEVVRRSEFSSHWKSLHLDIQLGQLVCRCPMRLYGCQFGSLNLTPQPEGSSLDYDVETDCFLYKMPSTILNSITTADAGSLYAAEIEKKQELALYGYEDVEEESFDVLGQLPAEVLMIICSFLDSQSLWVLSQVNHYLRKVCLNLVKRSGIVYWTWERDRSGTWELGHQVWSYSKVFRGLSAWRYTEEASIAAHMMSCDYIKANVKPYTSDMVLAMIQ